MKKFRKSHIAFPTGIYLFNSIHREKLQERFNTRFCINRICAGSDFSLYNQLKFHKLTEVSSNRHVLNGWFFQQILFSPFPSFSGAYGECYTSGTKLKCTSNFLGQPLSLEIDIKTCRRPVKIDLELDIYNQTFRGKFDGDHDIPLPGLSIGGLGGFVLNVNPNPRNNGDLQLKVRVWNCA